MNDTTEPRLHEFKTIASREAAGDIAERAVSALIGLRDVLEVTDEFVDGKGIASLIGMIADQIEPLRYAQWTRCMAE